MCSRRVTISVCVADLARWLWLLAVPRGLRGLARGVASGGQRLAPAPAAAANRWAALGDHRHAAVWLRSEDPVRADQQTGPNQRARQMGDARILTTHAGSLPRPPELTGLFTQRSLGKSVDEEALA